MSMSADAKPFACEFSECMAVSIFPVNKHVVSCTRSRLNRFSRQRFNSRAALSGHNRIHGGSAERPRMTTASLLNCGSGVGSDTTEEFPCKLCGK